MSDNKFEGLFIIGYGLGGGFGGRKIFEVIEAKNQDEADKYAWKSACDEYESYVGMYGLRDLSEIMEEHGIEHEGEAIEVYEQERESWLDYSAVPYSKEYENKVKHYHYNNPFSNITDAPDTANPSLPNQTATLKKVNSLAAS